MPVPSFEFLAFAAVVALFISFSDRPAWRRWVFLTANVGFVLSFTHDIVRLVPFAGLIAFGFASLKLMEKFRNRAAFIPLGVALVLAFCWLKRYSFLPAGTYLPFTYFAVGMSYVFFRIMHLTIDAYQDVLPGRVGLVSYLGYSLNFTCLVSGPIQLYSDYRKTECEKPAQLGLDAVSVALPRIILGFFKVAVLSVVLLLAQRACLSALSPSLPLGERIALGGLLLSLFPVYLYFNFSGYTDFVIGVARFLKLELPENFNRPFLAVGVIDFWTRWHMTLSNWLKTYVYSPLLLNLMRCFQDRKWQPYLGVMAYFVTFFLIGAWHGQTPKFLFFGLLTGLGISVNKLYEVGLSRGLGRVRYQNLCRSPYYTALCRGLNFTWFSFTMLWFWSDWPQLARIGSTIDSEAVMIMFPAVIVLSGFLLSGLKYLGDNLVAIHVRNMARFPYLRTAWYTALAATVISTAVLNAPAPHVVYKAF